MTIPELDDEYWLMVEEHVTESFTVLPRDRSVFSKTDLWKVRTRFDELEIRRTRFGEM